MTPVLLLSMRFCSAGSTVSPAPYSSNSHFRQASSVGFTLNSTSAARLTNSCGVVCCWRTSFCCAGPSICSSEGNITRSSSA
ncbi:hypothetical protein PF008_g20464 [Phytophthora fragariae]|uniref:Secreted protein n=1 Tax=Phytophthora fragariae TaxID=53985 RepID=A0A6G0QZN8_9STRA|nr:hypothetical protein PF008_g20464 [Phytophthora fragariae]